MAPVVKNLPASAGDLRDAGLILISGSGLILISGSGRFSGEGNGMATHSSILAWRMPWREEPGGLWCIELDMTEVTYTQARGMLERVKVLVEGYWSKQLKPWAARYSGELRRKKFCVTS